MWMDVVAARVLRTHPVSGHGPKGDSECSMNSSDTPGSCVSRSTNCGGLFDLATKRERAGELEALMAQPDFWSDQEKANAVIAEVKPLNLALKPFERIDGQLDDLDALNELAGEEGGDEVLPEIEGTLGQLNLALKQLEFHAMMSGATDACHAYVTIHAGAGGTESCDWVQMLHRMFLRWCEEHDFSTELLDLGPGEQAGMRSVTFAVKGEYAFGNLRSEIGVHRLVRISPFDANSRRHTSFASVDIMPELDDSIDIDIRDGDVEMETFTSGGPGGQHQNKTASGVRLRHMPTGVVVECRNERSQHKNRKTAMNMLKAKLYRIEQEKRDAELARLYDEKGEIAFGSQIRSYVLHPYQMVKDHRTNVEIGNAGAVLDGNIDPFIEAFLRSKIGEGE